MKTLICSTIQFFAILAIPVIFYSGLLLGSEISPRTQLESTAPDELHFVFDEEAYIQDIPFDTYQIANSGNWNHSQNQ